MKYRVSAGGRIWEIEIDGDRVRVGGTEHRAELRAVPGTPLRLLVLDGGSAAYPMENLARGLWVVQDGGERCLVEAVDERTAHVRSLIGTPAALAGPVALKAPMPGLVARVLVEPGEAVAAGQSLVVLEAMKMENELKAGAPGVAEKVCVAPGQTVEKGEVLVTFRP